MLCHLFLYHSSADEILQANPTIGFEYMTSVSTSISTRYMYVWVTCAGAKHSHVGTGPANIMPRLINFGR